MIRQYILSVDLPDHAIPFKPEAIADMLWDGMSFLHKDKIKVEDWPSEPGLVYLTLLANALRLPIEYQNKLKEALK